MAVQAAVVLALLVQLGESAAVGGTAGRREEKRRRRREYGMARGVGGQAVA